MRNFINAELDRIDWDPERFLPVFIAKAEGVKNNGRVVVEKLKKKKGAK